MLKRITLVVATTILLAPRADATWTPQQPLPGSAGSFPLLATYPRLATAPTVATYRPAGLVPRGQQVLVGLQQPTGALTFGVPQTLAGGLGIPVAVAPNGTAVAVGGPRGPLDYFSVEGQRHRLQVGIGPVTSGNLARIVVPRAVATKTLAAAVNDSGDAVVVYSRCLSKGCTFRAVEATFRRRGQAFGRPVVLSDKTGYPAASVSLNAKGDAVLAWMQRRVGRTGHVNALLRRADGTRTKVRTAGNATSAPTIATSITPGRHATVAWYTGAGSVRGGFAIYLNELDAKGTMHRRQVVAQGTPTGGDAFRSPQLKLISDPAGAVTVAWTGFENGHHVVRVMRELRGITDSQLLSPPSADAALLDLAGDSAGEAIVAWRTLSAPLVAAAIRSSGALRFGASEPVLTGANAAGTVAAAIAPGGHAIVLGAPEFQLDTTDPAPVVYSLLSR